MGYSKYEGKVIQPLLYVDKGETIKVVSVHANSCRRAMTKYIIQYQITRPEDILGFELDVFMYILLMWLIAWGLEWFEPPSTLPRRSLPRYATAFEITQARHSTKYDCHGYLKVEVTSKDKWKEENVSYNGYGR